MNLLIDTNVLLDVLTAREPFCEDSSRVWKICEVGMANGYVSTLSFANLVYIMRRELQPGSIEVVLDMLSRIFSLAAFTEQDLKRATSLHWEDFEDAVQYSIAKRIKADYIITRNERDYQKGSIAAISPEWVR